MKFNRIFRIILEFCILMDLEIVLESNILSTVFCIDNTKIQSKLDWDRSLGCQSVCNLTTEMSNFTNLANREFDAFVYLVNHCRLPGSLLSEVSEPIGNCSIFETILGNALRRGKMAKSDLSAQFIVVTE